MQKLTTTDGLSMLSSTVTGNQIVFDYLIFSETKSTVDISKITMSTLDNPKQIDINKVETVENGFMSTSVLDSNVNDSYKAQTVGLVGHTTANTTPRLISVSIADDVPIFVISPEQSGTTTITYTVEYANTSANVTSNLSNAKTATIDDVKYAVNLALGGADFQAKIANKADISYVDSGLAVKADKAYVDSNVSNLNASNAALQSSISSNSSGIASNGSQILSKANSADLTALQNVVNTTIARQQLTISSLQSKLSSAVQPISILRFGIGTINAYQIGNRYYLTGTVSWTAGNGTFNLSYLSSYGISGVSNIYNAPSSISLVGSVIQGDNSGGPATLDGSYLA